jgi:hypothetical protein
VQIEWDESDSAHRFMRRMGTDASASFMVDAIRTVVVDKRGPADTDFSDPDSSTTSKNHGAVRASFN